MNYKPHLAIGLIAILFLLPTACGSEVIALQATNPQATIPQATTPNTLTNVLTRTSTSTNTWIPSKTPTIGPPPDMELKNVMIYNETGGFEHLGQFYTFLGRIRNNTDRTMVIHDRTIVFKFMFEFWEYDTYFKYYWHVTFSNEAEQRPEYSRIVNCILYPREEGVFMYIKASTNPEYIIDEHFPQPNGPLGASYTYESYPNYEPDLRSDLHPETQNLSFAIKDGALVFDYDVDVPNFESQYTRLTSYIILLNENGEIINILLKNIGQMGGVHLGITYHVHGTTATPREDQEKYFTPVRELSRKMIEQVDRLEILNEFEGDSTC
jgi:hypothetical protein